MNDTWKKAEAGGYIGTADVDQMVWCPCGEKLWVQGVPFGEDTEGITCPGCGKVYRLVYALRLEEKVS